MLQLPDIAGAIRMDLNPLKQALSQAAGDAHAFSAETKGDLNQIATLDTGGFSAGLGAITTGAAVAGAAVIGAFAGATAFIGDATHDAFKLADDLHDMSINVGVAVESLHGLGLAAGLAGSGTADVAESYKFLGKNVAEAMQGSKEAIAGFDRMGVAFADASGKARPLEAVMMDVADGIKKLDAGARTEAAMQLLGRGGNQMIATLSQGSTALREQMRLFGQYGATVTTHAADAADAFGDMLGEFDIAWMGLKNAIGQPIIESLTPALEKILDWTRTNFPAIRDSVSAAFGAITNEIVALTRSFGTIAPAGNAWGSSIINASEGVSLSIAKAMDLFDTFERKRSAAGNWLKRKGIENDIDTQEIHVRFLEADANKGSDTARRMLVDARAQLAILKAQLQEAKNEETQTPTHHVDDVRASFKNIHASFDENMQNTRIDDALDAVLGPAEEWGATLFDRIDATLDAVLPKEGDEFVIDRVDEALGAILDPVEKSGKEMFDRIDATLDAVFPKDGLAGGVGGGTGGFKAEKLPDQPKFAEFIRGDTAEAFRFDQGRDSGDTSKQQLAVQQKMLRALEQANRNQPVILKMG
jgi:hypothetical protein